MLILGSSAHDSRAFETCPWVPRFGLLLREELGLGERWVDDQSGAGGRLRRRGIPWKSTPEVGRDLMQRSALGLLRGGPLIVWIGPEVPAILVKRQSGHPFRKTMTARR